MEWNYGEAQPREIESASIPGLLHRRINYDVEACENGFYPWRWHSVTLPPGVWNYGAIVGALVTAAYPADRMQAVVNNYLADPTDEESRQEMAQMQEYRAWAKAKAKDLLETCR